MNVFIFLIDSFFKTHFKIKPSHMQDSVLIYLSFNVIFKIKIKVIFIDIFFRGEGVGYLLRIPLQMKGTREE